MRNLARASIALLAFGLSTAAADANKPPVDFGEPDTAVHPNLKSYTFKQVEGGKETFKEVHTFDANGRLQKRDNYKNGRLIGSVAFTWDDKGNMLKRTDKDEDGKVSTIEFTYTFDKSGRIATKTGFGEKHTYRWDAKGGREVTTTNAANGEFRASESYNADGKLIKRCTSTAIVTKDIKPKTICEAREYDKKGRLTKKADQPADKSSTPSIYKHTYDKDGHLSKTEQTGISKVTTTFTWNANGDIATMTEKDADLSSTAVTTFTYEPR